MTYKRAGWLSGFSQGRVYSIPPGDPYAPTDAPSEHNVFFGSPIEKTLQFQKFNDFIHSIARLHRSCDHYVVDQLTEEFLEYALKHSSGDLICYEYRNAAGHLQHITTFYLFRENGARPQLNVFLFTDITLLLNFRLLKNKNIHFVLPFSFLFEDAHRTRCIISQKDLESCSFIAYKIARKIENILLMTKAPLYFYLKDFMIDKTTASQTVTEYLKPSGTQNLSLTGLEESQYHFKYDHEVMTIQIRMIIDDEFLDHARYYAYPKNFFSIIQNPRDLFLMHFFYKLYPHFEQITYLSARTDTRSAERIAWEYWFQPNEQLANYQQECLAQRDAAFGYSKYFDERSVKLRAKQLKKYDTREVPAVFKNNHLELRRSGLFILENPNATAEQLQQIASAAQSMGYTPTPAFQDRLQIMTHNDHSSLIQTQSPLLSTKK